VEVPEGGKRRALPTPVEAEEPTPAEPLWSAAPEVETALANEPTPEAVSDPTPEIVDETPEPEIVHETLEPEIVVEAPEPVVEHSPEPEPEPQPEPEAVTETFAERFAKTLAARAAEEQALDPIDEPVVEEYYEPPTQSAPLEDAVEVDSEVGDAEASDDTDKPRFSTAAVFRTAMLVTLVAAVGPAYLFLFRDYEWALKPTALLSALSAFLITNAVTSRSLV
jgi:hypothetical protein